MQVKFIKGTLSLKGSIVFLCSEKAPFKGFLKTLNEKSKKSIEKAMKVSGFTAEKDSKLEILCPQGTNLDRIILFGLGNKKNTSLSTFESVGSSIVAFLNLKKISEATICMDNSYDISKNFINSPSHLAFGAILNTYRFNKYFSDKKKMRELNITKLNVMCENFEKEKNNWKSLLELAEGIFLTRTLVSEPANVLFPEELAKQAKKLTKYGIKVEVLDESKLKQLKMGALLGVA